ncbi:serine/threonine-protein kinase [Nannocystis bainbridge]|uniref:Serine/threonine-protein kinase n=1 Tax=Nannocystis bainbridge TaxID=2995303 RepID=A0ABT5E3R5_9BACT|nr:serine/threonine-protein kinase [Nannocystis bainbridge]MDC0720390.1 serine/threonine-protein kinase [Nannocystis bainbridge]
MTEPPTQVPDGAAADARTRTDSPEPPAVQARPGRTRSHPRVADDEPAAPTRIRHFTVLRQVGQGGMGVVLSAFDDELDRKVAIKLMRPSQGDSLGRARLQREAQAMAKLAHPNIARVYEVGEFEGRVYIVMEYIQGETLRAWLRRGPHPWREVLAILLQAGRGLAAAHAVGLVHRDFKPDNVMVAEDGFVRVLDFGLARAVEAADVAPDAAALPRLVAPVHHSVGSLAEPLTEAGTLVGTPPYMSPEQFALQPIGVESDQFSFCVALYEGLYGARPFKARTADELLAQVEALPRSEPPRGTRAPPRLRRILLRGLAARPQDRWPSMAALLDELTREPGKRARQWFFGVGLAAAAAGLGYGLTPRVAAPEALCKDAASKFAGVWDDARKAELRQALRATGAAGADDVAQRVEARLDAYVGAWIAMHTEACEATHIRGEQSPLLLDRRMECLSLRRTEVDVLAQGLATADAAMLDRAVQATMNLGRLDRCADAEALQAALPPPEDPAQAAQVADVRAKLARVRVRGNLGQYEASRGLADEILQEAAALGYRPLHAEVLARHAQLLEYAGDAAGAEKAMLDAYFMAGAVKHDEVQAEAALALTFIHGVEQARYDDAMLWDRHAVMLLDRLGAPPLLQITRHTGLGGVLERWGKYAEARDHLERALQLAEADEGPESHNAATVAHNLGGVYLAQGDLAASEQMYQRALASYMHLLGPENLSVADTLNNLAMTAQQGGDLPGAQDRLLRALAIYERSIGLEHPRLSIPLVNLGSVAAARRDFAAAHAHYQRALAVTEKALGADDLEVAEPLAGLAELAALERRWDDAESLAGRALALHARVQGPAQPGQILPLCALGEVALARREYADARVHFQRALEVAEATYGPQDSSTATALGGLARAAIGEQQPAQALPLLARATAIRDQPHGLPHELAALLFVEAQARQQARDAAAADVARRALTLYTTAGERFASERAAVEAWLAHPR